MTEAGESQGSESGGRSGAERFGSRAVRLEPGEESVASYARISQRRPRQRPTRSELLGGGDASKAPKRLAADELHPIEGDSSGHSWDDPDEL